MCMFDRRNVVKYAVGMVIQLKNMLLIWVFTMQPGPLWTACVLMKGSTNSRLHQQERTILIALSSGKHGVQCGVSAACSLLCVNSGDHSPTERGRQRV